MTDIDFDRIDALTFDCYGTLIDWETGITRGLRLLLEPHGVQAGDDELLEAYAREEAALEAGPYLRYREVLARAARGVAAGLGVTPSDDELATFGGSVGDWPAFEDTADALRRLKERFRLGVITNCDDDLFAASNRRLGVTFDWVITAQQVGAYKPSHRNFDVAFAVIDVPRPRILHVAQSLYHDHVPAQARGLSTAWIDRRHDKAGSGATPPATVTPDLRAPDMRSFADLALGGAARPAGVAPMTTRVGQVIRVRPESIEAYEAIHAAVWPGVLAAIRRANIRDYSIHRFGEFLFATYRHDGDDLAADLAAMAADPVVKEWWTHTDAMQAAVPERLPGEWWHTIPEVFHTD